VFVRWSLTGQDKVDAGKCGVERFVLEPSV
jgi:hypothetical protein